MKFLVFGTRHRRPSLILTLTIIVVVAYCFGSCEGKGDVSHDGIDSDGDDPVEMFTSTVYRFLKRVVNELRNGDGGGASDQRCRSDVDEVVREAGLGREWAMRIFDSMGKPGSGILNGGVNFPGYFSECVQGRNELGNVNGKYCLTRVKFQLHQVEPEQNQSTYDHRLWDFSVGFCVPSSCNQHEVNRAAQSAAQSLNGKAETDECYVEIESFTLDAVTGFIIWLFVSSVLLAIVGTAVDLRKSFRDESGPRSSPVISDSAGIVNVTATSSTASTTSSSSLSSSEPLFKKKTTTESFLFGLLRAFSLPSNVRKILAPPSPEGATLGALHGIRFLSMAWIIVGHTFVFAQKWLFFRNPDVMTAATKHTLSQAFANGTFSVDTFFFLSGFLVAYTLLKRLKLTDGRFNIFHFYIHRYLRMTPVMMMVIAFSSTFLKYLGSGPSWRQATVMYDDWCRENWWVNALYMQNFYQSHHMCQSHTWYSAVDMQFYLVAPAIICLLYKYVNRGLAAVIVPFLVTSICPVVYTIIYHLPAIPSDTVPLSLLNEYYALVYIKPYCRMGPYLVGISFAYFMYRKNSFRLSKGHQAIGWIIAILVNGGVILSMSRVFNSNPPTDAEAAVYNGLARTAWAATVGWVAIVCVSDNSSLLNRILSARITVPLSRLTYSAYLVHPMLMAIFYGTREEVFDFSLSWLVYLFIGNLVITYAVSIVLSLLFELPVMNVEKLLCETRTNHLRFITSEEPNCPESLLKN